MPGAVPGSAPGEVHPEHDRAGRRRAERRDQDPGRRDVLGALRERVLLGRDQIDDRFERGVEQLGRDEQRDGERDQRPRERPKT